MIKNQSIIDLWISSGNLLLEDDPNQSDVIANLDDYYLMMARLEVLCLASHDMRTSDVIPRYVREGWL